MTTNVENKPKAGDCYLIKDLYLYKGLDPDTGHLYDIEMVDRNFFYVICLDILKINLVTILVLFCEEGIRYSHVRIFLSSASLDKPTVTS